MSLMLAMLGKALKYVDTKDTIGIELRHRLELCCKALIAMDDTDSLLDSLYCRDYDVLIDVLKTLIVPPYGLLRLMFQMGNVPSLWF